MILDEDIQKKLDERIFEENIGLASLHNLERLFLGKYQIAQRT
jgi:hypothetical protein